MVTKGISQFDARVMTPDPSKFVTTDSQNDISFLRSGLNFYQ